MKRINHMNDLVSIIIPTYNAGIYLKRCLDSIIQQTYKRIEIIVVDDGSTDDTDAFLKQYFKNNAIKHKIVRQCNQGVSAARNLGIREAAGTWVIALDADDFIDVNTIEKCLKVANTNNLNAIGFGFDKANNVNVSSKENFKYSILSGKQAINAFYRRKVKFISPAMLIKKRFLEINRITYDEGCLFAEDDLYVWKVLASVGAIGYIDSCLYHYYTRENSTMTKKGIERFLTVVKFTEDTYKDFILLSVNTIEIRDKFVARHYLGVLHAAALVNNYSNFLTLFNKMNFKMTVDNINKNDFEKKIFTMAGKFPHILYLTLKKVK